MTSRSYVVSIAVELFANAVGHGDGTAERTSVRLRGQGSQAIGPETSDDGGRDLCDVQGLLYRMQGRRRPATTLHKGRQER